MVRYANDIVGVNRKRDVHGMETTRPNCAALHEENSHAAHPVTSDALFLLLGVVRIA